MSYLSVVIPAYNEENNLRQTLASIEDFLASVGWDYEVLIVDDGSRDRTVEVAEKYIEGKRPFRLLKNPHRGKAYAVKTGMLAAEGEYVLFSDADLATPIKEVRRLLLWLTDHDFDLAIASREGIGARREGEPFYRHLMGRVFNRLVQSLALRGIEDSQCGFKLFKREAAQKIFTRLYVYGGEGNEIKHAYTGAFDVEVLFLARKYGYRVKDVPVEWSFVKTPRVNALRDSVKMFRDVVMIRWADLRGRYGNIDHLAP